MNRRVAHDFAPSLIAGVGRKAILENGNVIVRLGNLGFGLPRTRRTKRAVVGRRVIGAGLPPGCDRHPLLEQRMPAELAQTWPPIFVDGLP